MAEKEYSTQDVIEALAAEDFTEEQIRILVPILAYESRVGGKPFVLSAKDSESPSYGLGQANVTTMESAIWMAINETGGEIPGATEQQLRQWETSIVQENEEDVREYLYEANNTYNSDISDIKSQISKAIKRVFFANF